MSKNTDKQLAAFIVPTGIGAKIGGFAGDASRFAQKLAKKIPLIVNPNVVNAACFSGITDNMFYTEGWTITQLFKNKLSLVPSCNNKIGVIFDKAISQDILNVHINTINAVKTVYDCDVMGYEITEEECGVEFFMTDSGISSGRVMNQETLVEAGRKLIDRGADTIAVVCKFDEPPEDDYMHGDSADIVGGVEAIISHYLTRELLVPVVHSPAFEDISVTTDIVDARAAAEYITPTFLPCLLLGLKNAPLISQNFQEKNLTLDNLIYLIMPYDSLGSSIVLDAIKNNIKVIAIKENETVLNVDDYSLSINNDIMILDSYDDCFNYLSEVEFNAK